MYFASVFLSACMTCSGLWVENCIRTYASVIAKLQYADLGQLGNDPRARSAVLADMDALGREAQASTL